jgi:hypothetical protein
MTRSLTQNGWSGSKIYVKRLKLKRKRRTVKILLSVASQIKTKNF